MARYVLGVPSAVGAELGLTHAVLYVEHGRAQAVAAACKYVLRLVEQHISVVNGILQLVKLLGQSCRRLVQRGKIGSCGIVKARLRRCPEPASRIVARNADKCRCLLELLRGKRQSGHGHLGGKAAAVYIRAQPTGQLRPGRVGRTVQRVGKARCGIYDLLEGMCVAVLGRAAIASLHAEVHRRVRAQRDDRRGEICDDEYKRLFSYIHGNTSCEVFPKPRRLCRRLAMGNTASDKRNEITKRPPVT